MERLPTSLCQRILHHFALPPRPPPTLETLRRLVESYTRTVPWESASRIVRRARHVSAPDCALLGADFWESHFARGTGGTCFESNYAFFGLLRWLGYEGYLTINNMVDLVGCHSAIIVQLDGQKYLVDVGLPVHALLLIDPARETEAESAVMRYSTTPLGGNRYDISRRPHPISNAFTLIDAPIPLDKYRQAAIHDYRHDGGLFLDKIVFNKVVADQLWRFNSDEQPWCLQQFVGGERRDHTLGADAADALSATFGIAREVVAEALAALGLPPIPG